VVQLVRTYCALLTPGDGFGYAYRTSHERRMNEGWTLSEYCYERIFDCDKGENSIYKFGICIVNVRPLIIKIFIESIFLVELKHCQ
jgi:hypothetical protein